jgi:hypothetical protein
MRELLCRRRRFRLDNRWVVHDASRPVRDDSGSVGEAAVGDAVRSGTGLTGGCGQVPAMRDRLDGEASCRFQGHTWPPGRDDLISLGQRQPGRPDRSRQPCVRDGEFRIGNVGDHVRNAPCRNALGGSESPARGTDEVTEQSSDVEIHAGGRCFQRLAGRLCHQVRDPVEGIEVVLPLRWHDHANTIVPGARRRGASARRQFGWPLPRCVGASGTAV